MGLQSQKRRELCSSTSTRRGAWDGCDGESRRRQRRAAGSRQQLPLCCAVPLLQRQRPPPLLFPAQSGGGGGSGRSIEAPRLAVAATHVPALRQQQLLRLLVGDILRRCAALPRCCAFVALSARCLLALAALSSGSPAVGPVGSSRRLTAARVATTLAAAAPAAGRICGCDGGGGAGKVS